MANYESGHHINVENLDPLMRRIESMGGVYKPIKKALLLTNIQSLYDNGKLKLKDVNDTFGVWKIVVDDRQAEFKKIKTIVSRIIGNLYGMEVPASFIEDAKQLQAKINSVRLTKPKPKDIDNDLNPDKTQHSVSQQSFNSVLHNFSGFLSLLDKSPEYKTNIADLTIPALKEFHTQLEKANKGMNKAAEALSSARIARNIYLYTPETGLVDTALSVKNFIKGIFGASHPTYLEVKKISFRNINK